MENSVIISRDAGSLLSKEPFIMATFMYYALRSRKQDEELVKSVGICSVNENDQQVDTGMDMLHIKAADGFLKKEKICSFSVDAVGMKDVTIRKFVDYPDVSAARKAKALLSRHKGRIAPTEIELHKSWSECSDGTRQWLKDNCPNIFYTYTHLITDKEVNDLAEKFHCDTGVIWDTIRDIDNSDTLWWKYHNLYRTVRKWMQLRQSWQRS